MDTLSHALIGMAVAGLSGHPLSASDPVYIAAVLGAQAPDLDIIAGLRGGMAYLRQHRAMSHSVPGVTAWSALIAAGLCFFVPDIAFTKAFGWAFAGGLSHIIVDYFNTHGAAVLWPLRKERKSCHLLNVFDPILILLMLSLYTYPLPMRHVALATFTLLVSYLGLRLALRHRAAKWLTGYFAGHAVMRVTIMPSLQRIFFWDFVIETTDRYFVGQVGALYPVLAVRAELSKQRISEITAMAQNTFLGQFFQSFTPFRHVEEEQAENGKAVHIYDLRYFCGEEFRHRATIYFDDANTPRDAYIHSYGRKIRVPC
ncbi:metal-dependent hydrolase [Sporolituus thermophilus]|uniref:Inner membrane protein n=1 Tax=Sporolituus thermophilus DSM 23256 TaxID=1123285 RepID=A0A1G7JB74_9FIRM|nr:metal-dependent hydrolase [Sporolituus thermophilus]SDF22136.1 inner membrane protein [Sporolituus thermophilus DSM 23256]